MAQLPNGGIAAAYDAIFWEWWDMIYPLDGIQQRPHTLTVAANIAAREVFLMQAWGGILDYSLDPAACAGKVQSVPRKSTWRFQLAKPVKAASPIIAGRTEILWGINANPPYLDGNFLWVLFQKMVCCQKVQGG